MAAPFYRIDSWQMLKASRTIDKENMEKLLDQGGFTLAEYDEADDSTKGDMVWEAMNHFGAWYDWEWQEKYQQIDDAGLSVKELQDADAWYDGKKES